MNDEPRKLQRFLTVEQAAQELNVSGAAIRALRRSGELRGFQVGGRGQWRTGIDDLQAYIDEAYRKVEEKVVRADFADAEVGEE
jgi:excisionase family DNA binding protein